MQVVGLTNYFIIRVRSRSQTVSANEKPIFPRMEESAVKT